MRLGLKATLVVILLVAGALPLIAGLIMIEWMGHAYYRTSKGDLFRTIAAEHAYALSQVVRGEVDNLRAWTHLIGLGRAMDEAEALEPKLSIEQAENLELQWPHLPPESPRLKPFLDSPLAHRISAYQAYHPRLVELFVTDARGGLVAASNKTSDYWQADEDWWQKAFALGPKQVLVTGIQLDESAGVYSLDISFPIFAGTGNTLRRTGVVKSVFNASPLLASAASTLAKGEPRRDVVLGDGRLLQRLSGTRVAPTDIYIHGNAVARFDPDRPTWFHGLLTSDSDELVGAAPLRISGPDSETTIIAELSPVYVLVHDDLRRVLSPIRHQLLLLTLVSGATVLVFILIGLAIADRRIVYPLRLLQSVARNIAATAHLKGTAVDSRTGETAGKTPPVDITADANLLIHDAENLRSVDEIQEFAQDFGLMARRVVNYHQQLEREIESKTVQIQRDLDLAREFQEALMPTTYPEIPPPRSRDPIRLSFSHIYKPAFLVGGDFFDVLCVSEHAAGILVADVVGHGARSALVTAILRTLIQDSEAYADTPGDFLTVINKRFYDIMPHDSECVFATLFYLVIDTRQQRAAFASAGHPSPLLADKRTGDIEELADRDSRGPAIGLFIDTTYATHTRHVNAGNTFILCTDGLFEARNAQDEEFGRERLKHIFSLRLGEDGSTITRDIMHHWHQFMGTAVAEDDICLIAVELLEQDRERKKPRPDAMQANLPPSVSG
jgi:serine phosphatase RsbU (regulator of sigma subunit)